MGCCFCFFNLSNSEVIFSIFDHPLFLLREPFLRGAALGYEQTSPGSKSDVGFSAGLSFCLTSTDVSTGLLEEGKTVSGLSVTAVHRKSSAVNMLRLNG